MLSLSRKTDYAILILTALAKQPGDLVSLKTLAVTHKMPYRFLAQVVRPLAKSGLIASREGTAGGYRLAVSPRKISVRQVVAIIEGGVAMAGCYSKNGKRCALINNCSLRQEIPSVQKMVLETLDKKSIADLAKSRRGKS